MKVLFICNQNQHRSKTAEELFRDRFETKSAGLYNTEQVSEETFRWADVVVVMEEEQREELGKRFPETYLKKRILSLDIPDIYIYMQPELITALNEKIKEVLQPILQTAA